MTKAKFDFHVHTDFSNDSETPMRSVIETAIKLGISELAFTDHIDYDYDSQAEITDWTFDVDKYFETIEAFSHEYKGKILLRKGVEFGVQPHLKERMEALINAYPFDFVIGSQHTVDETDLYNRRYFTFREDKESIRHYYEEYHKCAISTEAYSVLGHLDLFVRYKKELMAHNPKDNFDILEETFKHLASHGKGIELNAGGFKYGLNTNNPTDQILKFYKECGGEIITLGSDAHTTDFLASQFDHNIDLLKALGFKYVTTFNQLKPVFHPIDKL